MRTSPMADKAFQEVIDYEVGVTLLQAAKLLPLPKREQQLDEARSYFQKFLADHFQHALVTGTKRYLATILIEQAEIKTERARGPGIAPAGEAAAAGRGPHALARGRAVAERHRR